MAASYEYNKDTYEFFAKSKNEYAPVPGGLGKHIFDRLKGLSLDESLIAQIHPETGAKQNFKELFASSIKLAQYMRNYGIQPGDNITLCSYNHFNATVVMIASQFIGAVPSCTDPIISLEDTKHLLNLVDPRIVFVSGDSENLIKSALEYHKLSAKIISVTLENHDEYETIDGILKQTNVEDTFEPAFVEDVSSTCVILFSSGTTGLPKGMCLPHTLFLSFIGDYPQVDLQLPLLNYASFYWISSVYALLYSIQLGSPRLVCKAFDKEKHWDLLEKYEVSLIVISNTYTMEASKYLTKEKAEKLTHLKSFIIGGGPVPEHYVSFYDKMLPSDTTVGSAYALTETGVVTQFTKGDKFTSCGKFYHNNQIIRIVDPDTEENQPLNKVGEIRIKKPYQMNGYYNKDSKDAWDEQGFFKTGDLGYIDDEFHLFIVDRIKEMFKYRSWHVVPTKIEDLLLTHPDVRYALVFGKPTYDMDENHAMAVVCLQNGSSTTAKDLEDFVNDKMDGVNKIRAGVHLVDASELVFTATAKLNRRLIKNKFVK